VILDEARAHGPMAAARPMHSRAHTIGVRAMTTAPASAERNLSKLETQLKAWGAKLEDAVAKAGTRAKAESHKQLDELKARLEVARAKLDEAKAAGGDKWETLKDDVEHVWNELEVSFKKLIH
jgi:hypothetical protein